MTPVERATKALLTSQHVEGRDDMPRPEMAARIVLGAAVDVDELANVLAASRGSASALLGGYHLKDLVAAHAVRAHLLGVDQ